MNKLMLLAVVAGGVLFSNAAVALAEGVSATAAVAATSSTGPVPAGALPAALANNPLDIAATDRVMGSPMAPVTIIEYASMTCSHCGDFNREAFPLVKKEWIDTGKAKYVLRDLPWDNLALGMSKIARCAPANEFYPLVETFFANQEKIVTGKDPLGEIKKITRVAGMTDDKVDACVKDAALHAEVTGSKDTAMNRLGVKGTPAFFVNSARVEGAASYKDFKKTLDAEYAKATKK